MNDVEKYQGCMHEIKNRLVLVTGFLGGQFNLGSEQSNYEVVSLNLRKCLELIAFSSLAANRQKYSELFKDYHRHWKAKSLLEEIKEIHPEFYPKPIEFDSVNEEGVKHFRDVTDGYLTKDEFVFLYDMCSEVLHVWNPYTEKEKKIHFKRPVSEWVARIDRLLRFHYIRMIDKKELWLVDMYYPPDQTVHTFVAPPQD
jgi:hypothetical protein